MSVPPHQLVQSRSQTHSAFKHFMVIRPPAEQPILPDPRYYHFELGYKHKACVRLFMCSLKGCFEIIAMQKEFASSTEKEWMMRV